MNKGESNPEASRVEPVLAPGEARLKLLNDFLPSLPPRSTALHDQPLIKGRTNILRTAIE